MVHVSILQWRRLGDCVTREATHHGRDSLHKFRGWLDCLFVSIAPRCTLHACNRTGQADPGLIYASLSLGWRLRSIKASALEDKQI